MTYANLIGADFLCQAALHHLLQGLLLALRLSRQLGAAVAEARDIFLPEHTRTGPSYSAAETHETRGPVQSSRAPTQDDGNFGFMRWCKAVKDEDMRKAQ